MTTEEHGMSERKQDREPESGHGDGAGDLPNERGAAESERREQSELAGQRRASERARMRTEEGSDRSSPAASPDRPGSERSNADRAKENERQAEEEGRELPG